MDTEEEVKVSLKKRNKDYEYIPVPKEFTRRIDIIKVFRGDKDRQIVFKELCKDLDPIIERYAFRKEEPLDKKKKRSVFDFP